jgi:hypothetical protein
VLSDSLVFLHLCGWALPPRGWEGDGMGGGGLGRAAVKVRGLKIYAFVLS